MDASSGRVSWTWAFCGRVAITNGPERIFSKRSTWRDSLGDAELQAHSLNRLGNWLLNTGQIAEVLATHHEALALFEAQHDQPGMAETLDLLGTVYSISVT